MQTLYPTGSSRNGIIFTRVNRVRWGRVVNGHHTHFLNVYYDALHFHAGLLKMNIFKVLFSGGRGSQKEYSVYAYINNVDNSGRTINDVTLSRTVSFTLSKVFFDSFWLISGLFWMFFARYT